MSVSRSQSPACPVAPYEFTTHARSIHQSRRRLDSGGRAHLRLDAALHHWLDTFHFFHTDSPAYAPVALRMEIGLSVTDSATGIRNKKVQIAATARYVYEVALCRDARGERWVLIAWEVDVPGIQFCNCADRDEAMALFAEPAKAGGRWHGVRLRLECRPW